MHPTIYACVCVCVCACMCVCVCVYVCVREPKRLCGFRFIHILSGCCLDAESTFEVKLPYRTSFGSELCLRVGLLLKQEFSY